MRRVLCLTCLLAAGLLGGCANMPQSFSCAPQLSPNRIDTDQFTRAPTYQGTHYLHC